MTCGSRGRTRAGGARRPAPPEGDEGDGRRVAGARVLHVAHPGERVVNVLHVHCRIRPRGRSGRRRPSWPRRRPSIRGEPRRGGGSPTGAVAMSARARRPRPRAGRLDGVPRQREYQGPRPPAGGRDGRSHHQGLAALHFMMGRGGLVRGSDVALTLS